VLGDALPDGDVHDLAGALSRIGRSPGPGVVFLSSHLEVGDIERALQSGAADYVTKPFSPQELVHRLTVVQLRRRLTDHGQA